MVAWVQDDYAAAESRCRRALKIQEETLGPEHPTISRTLSHLAVLNQVQAKYDVDDVVLWQKGFVARSVAAVRARIEASGDKEALGVAGRRGEAGSSAGQRVP